jgi:hypothetical protein
MNTHLKCAKRIDLIPNVLTTIKLKKKVKKEDEKEKVAGEEREESFWQSFLDAFPFMRPGVVGMAKKD